MARANYSNNTINARELTQAQFPRSDQQNKAH
jgi:hypothetical protein